jgi:hypothetical protein
MAFFWVVDLLADRAGGVESIGGSVQDGQFGGHVRTDLERGSEREVGQTRAQQARFD